MTASIADLWALYFGGGADAAYAALKAYADAGIDVLDVLAVASGTDTAEIVDGAVTTDKLHDSSVTSAKIVDGTIVNADINASAAIAKSKLASLAIVNADVDAAAAIAYSKLNLSASITAADVAAANKDGVAATASLRTLGAGAAQAAQGADPLALGFVTNGLVSHMADASNAGSANRCAYTRCIAGGISISALVFRVGTSSGNCSVAVYTSTGTGRSRVPDTRSQTSGAVAMPASGDASISLGGAITPALTDFLAYSVDNGTAIVQVLSNAVANMSSNGTSYYQDSAHPAPTPATPIAGSVRSPWLGS